MPSAVPVVWRVPSNHSTDCYFCIVPHIQNGISMKKKANFVYPNIPSAIRPLPHGDELPVPEPPDNFALYSDDEQPRTAAVSFKRCRLLAKHRLLTESELNDLIRDLELPKNKAELLASKLQQWNLLHHEGKWSAAMLGDYCCMMTRDASKTKHNRQAKRTHR